MARERPGSALPHIHRLFAEGSLSGLSDGQLLDRYVTWRDGLAFEALVERHARLVLGVCRRSLDEPGQLDDAFQATFLAEIERLPSAFRLPVVLCLMEGKTRTEAADALCWTEGMVRGRLARARILLRTRLTRRGIAPAAALAALAREATAAGAVPRGLIEGTIRAASHPATGSAPRP